MVGLFCCVLKRLKKLENKSNPQNFSNPKNFEVPLNPYKGRRVLPNPPNVYERPINVTAVYDDFRY
jgi:hypothetical protein